MPGRPVSLDNGRARAYCACSRCEWGSSDIFFSVAYHFSFPPPSVWGGWMDDFSIESQLYQDDGWVMDDCAQSKSHLRSKRSWPQAVLEFGTTRLAGQRLHHRATGTPVSVRWLDIDRNTVSPTKCSNAHYRIASRKPTMSLKSKWNY